MPGGVGGAEPRGSPLSRFGIDANKRMPTFEFQVVLADVGVITEEVGDTFYEAGCDDGTPFNSGGIAAV